MKRILTSIALLSVVLISSAQVRMPQPSPTQTIKQDFGVGTIELTYSRPSLKGREAFKDNSPVAPLNKLWRLGANAATRITLNYPSTIGGKLLDTGSYVMYAIPGEKEWDIIFNKGLSNWGTDGYKETEDVVRFKAPVYPLSEDIENFTMQFDNIKPESCDLYMMWAKTVVAFPIKVEIRKKIKEDIDNALKGEKKPYYQAANFYYEWEKDNAKALEYATLATEANKEAFWIFLLKAKIQRDMKDKAGATASAQKCIELAGAQKNDEYVKLGKELIASLK